MGPDSSLTPELIQAQSFTTAFRGYDSAEVKSFLSRVSKELRAWRERAEQLESAWHSAEERAARPPVLDEDTLMAAVGEETAAILRTARAAATELRSKAADEAERALTEAREEAERTVTEARQEAERVLSHSRSEADRLLEEARTEASRLDTEAKSALGSATEAAEDAAARILSSAREEAAGLVSRASTEAEEIRAAADKERQLTIEGANTTRDRILEDLSRRRRVATVQIEQLRAGRERLIESYAVVRRTLEEVQTELSRADAEARAAADEVGRRLQRQAEVELSEKEPSRVVVSDEERAEGAADGAETGAASSGAGSPEAASSGPESSAVESSGASGAQSSGEVIPEASATEASSPAASSPAGKDTAASPSPDEAAEPAESTESAGSEPAGSEPAETTEPAGSEPAGSEPAGSAAGEPDAAPEASGGSGRGSGGQVAPYDREVDEEGPGSAVDELFARIRADRGPAGSGSTDSPSPVDEQPLPPYFAGARAARSGEASARSTGGDQVVAGSAPEAPGAAGAAPEATGAGGPPPEAAGAASSASGPVAGGSAPGPDTAGGNAGTTSAAGRKSRKRTARAERSLATGGGSGSTATGGASGSTPARTAPAEAPRSPAHPAATHSSVRVISAEGPTVDSGEPAADSPRSGRAGREPNSEEGAPRAATESEADRDDLVPDADEQLLQAREFAVVELETSLTRRLKRALQDEQNDVLDRLRNLKEAPTVARLLPDADGHRERYVAAARPLLVDAATAGAAFADETLGLEARPSAGAVEVEDLARECASSIVDALRRRLEQAMERGRGEDQSVLVDSLGAAYREWKTQRIERLAGDVLAGAFSRGTWTAAPDGALFRWVVEDVDGPCPDCDDDALAGSIPRSEPFPTGQPYPPAHSGCRCLLVPSLPGS
ncbi:MAG: DivIVA domain-containing protein [Acidobacteriota bacterium]|nr:DivIVA domain-containing protein [Acidobacteriota bacterium]